MLDSPHGAVKPLKQEEDPLPGLLSHLRDRQRRPAHRNRQSVPCRRIISKDIEMLLELLQEIHVQEVQAADAAARAVRCPDQNKGRQVRLIP